MGNVLLGAISLGSLWAVMALGVYITYRILDVADLTVEGTITLGASICARLLSGGINPWAATLVAAVCFFGYLVAGFSGNAWITILSSVVLLLGALGGIAFRGKRRRGRGKH